MVGCRREQPCGFRRVCVAVANVFVVGAVVVTDALLQERDSSAGGDIDGGRMGALAGVVGAAMVAGQVVVWWSAKSMCGETCAGETGVWESTERKTRALNTVASHDLRTVVKVILATNKLMVSNPRVLKSETMQLYMQVQGANCGKLQSILDNMLESEQAQMVNSRAVRLPCAEIDSETQLFRHVDLRELLEDQLQMARLSHVRKGVCLAWQVVLHPCVEGLGTCREAVVDMVGSVGSAVSGSPSSADGSHPQWSDSEDTSSSEDGVVEGGISSADWHMHAIVDNERVEPIGVHMTRRVLQIVISNFLSNAVKFTDHGEIFLRVEVDTVAEVIIVEVHDTGIGVADADKQVIFERFRQLVPERGGFGLGLFAVQTVCKRAGGTCGMRARVDGESGCVFWARIPVIVCVNHSVCGMGKEFRGDEAC